MYIHTMESYPTKKRIMLYMLQREWPLRTLCWVKKATKATYYWFHLYEMSSIGESIEAEITLVVVRIWGKGGIWYNSNRYGVSLGNDKNILEVHSPAEYTTL